MDTRELAARRIAEAVANYIHLCINEHMSSNAIPEKEKVVTASDFTTFAEEVRKNWQECDFKQREFIKKMIDHQGGLANINPMHYEAFVQKVIAVKENSR